MNAEQRLRSEAAICDDTVEVIAEDIARGWVGVADNEYAARFSKEDGAAVARAALLAQSCRLGADALALLREIGECQAFSCDCLTYDADDPRRGTLHERIATLLAAATKGET